MSDQRVNLRIRERALERWHHLVLRASANLCGNRLIRHRQHSRRLQRLDPGASSHARRWYPFTTVATSAGIIEDASSVDRAVSDLALAAGREPKARGATKTEAETETEKRREEDAHGRWIACPLTKVPSLAPPLPACLSLVRTVEGSQDSWIGRRLGGRYEVLDVIGEGGMGVVYRAKQVSIDRVVAIKMMHARAAQDPRWVDRFHSEAKACSLLTHPNTVRLYDFGQTTLGNLYMVMEYLEGRSLRQQIEEEGPIPAPRVLRILMQCCASLSEAHSAGIIHRDIKPDNIIVQNLPGASEFIKLFDFSIAKRTDVAMTAAGMVFGTPQFMSPEQARGKSIDHRSDLYSLGVVAYAMLTAALPFHHEDPIEVLRMHQTAQVPPLPAFVPDSVARVVLACLQKEPSKRPATALALLEACKVWLTQLDPSLDLAADPVLKNTLISAHPAGASLDTREGVAPPGNDDITAFNPISTSAKTMLSASGASSLRTPAPESETPAPHASMLREEPTRRAPVSSVMATLLRPAPVPVGQPAAAPVHSSSARSHEQGMEDARREAEARHSAPAAEAYAPAADAYGPATEAYAPAADAYAPAAEAYVPAPGQAHAQHPPGNAPSSGAQPAAQGWDASSAPMEPRPAPPSPLVPDFDTPMPMPAATGVGRFVALCVLVAVTFGAGGYYLASMLR